MTGACEEFPTMHLSLPNKSCTDSAVRQMQLRPTSSLLALYLLLPTFLLIGTSRSKKTWPQNFPQEELRKRLTPMQYHITQEKGTESAFRGEYTDHKEEGTYRCVVCGAPLFADQSQTSCVVCSLCCRPASYRLNFLFCQSTATLLHSLLGSIH
ncbi:methionine-R-sulfoxide reductase B3 isoform X2 [Clarias magur]|uniref:L-methionine (R)-S-oxide reductase n=1 Tax=Clarias magur TaxID=1594786 RepID=A0A8J4XAY2_CLAMG|nr:methionine-R-sulfoxide reductase B3 isoform X2 [Clarias magur]